MSADDRGLMHQALLYDGQPEFLTVAVPFVRAGLELDEAVIAVVPEDNLEALRDTMGRDGAGVRFIDAGQWYEHPVRTIRDYCDFVESSAPQRVRALAEPIWHGRTRQEVLDWTRYESVVNAVFADSGARVICGYDRRKVAPQVLDAAQRTHPELLIGPHQEGSRTYTAPEAFLSGGDRVPLPRAPEGAESIRLDSPDLSALRELIRDQAERHRMDPAVASAFITAAVEVAANAVRHGTPPMAAKVWAERGNIVCEVADYGHWRPGSLLGFLPRKPGTGLGMWGVRLLADHVQVRTGWDGTIVRLSSRLRQATDGSFGRPPATGPQLQPST